MSDSKIAITEIQPDTIIKRGRRRAFTILEVLFALMIFLMMVLMFGAVISTVARNARYSSNYPIAMQMAQRKIDQIRDLGLSNTTASYMQGKGIIDSVTPVASAANTATYACTTSDNLTAYFPSGSTGTVTIENYAPSWNGSNYTLLRVQVDIKWTDAKGVAGSYSTANLVGSNG